MTRAPTPPETPAPETPAPVRNASTRCSSGKTTPATPSSTNTTPTATTPPTPDQFATEIRMLRQLINHRDDAVIFIEHAPKVANSRGAKCRLRTCGKVIDPGSDRLCLHPGIMSPDGDFYHIRCFENICDFSNRKYLKLLTPLTRNTFEPRNLKPSQLQSGSFFVNSGAERLVLEFKAKRLSLLPSPKIKKEIKDETKQENKQEPKQEEPNIKAEIKQEELDDDDVIFNKLKEEEDYTDILQNAGSAFYVPPRRPRGLMSKREYQLHVNELAVWESEAEDDDWSLFEEVLTHERVDLGNRNGLSEALAAWGKAVKIAAQEYNHTAADQKLRDGFGENGIKGIVRLSETIIS